MAPLNININAIHYIAYIFYNKKKCLENCMRSK